MQYNSASGEFRAKDFSLLHTYSSGQTLNFLGEMTTGKLESLSFSTTSGIFKVIYARAKGRQEGIVKWSYAGMQASAAESTLMQMLGMHNDIKHVYKQIGKDKIMARAIRQFYGMRLTKSDPWLAASCFIASQYNSIKRIRQITIKLINKFGRKNGLSVFPSCKAIAKASEGSLRSCGLGFRAKYLKEFAEAYSEQGMDYLYALSYEKAKSELMQFNGIGDKVADCILLFGYGKTEAFPIDVWIKRSIEKLYFKGERQSTNAIHSFAAERFGLFAGYAQQYLYQYARQNNIK
ncbi:MAG: DNA-3-methyladenine glycosylase 2 [Candidatus Micrarchaeia archaeon]